MNLKNSQLVFHTSLNWELDSRDGSVESCKFRASENLKKKKKKKKLR